MPILRENKDLKNATPELPHHLRRRHLARSLQAQLLRNPMSCRATDFKLYFVKPEFTLTEIILGEKVYASINDVRTISTSWMPFRRPSAVPALQRKPKKKGFQVFWMQPGAGKPGGHKGWIVKDTAWVAGRAPR